MMELLYSLRSLLSFRVHPGGIGPIAVVFLLNLVLFWLSSTLGWVGALLSVWCVYFFRDPDRFPLNWKETVVSPGDGLIVDVSTVSLPPFLRKEMDNMPEEANRSWQKVSIFLSIFDVHVNRLPLAGKIVKKVYHPGKFVNASLDKASHLNERMALCILGNPLPQEHCGLHKVPQAGIMDSDVEDVQVPALEDLIDEPAGAEVVPSADGNTASVSSQDPKETDRSIDRSAPFYVWCIQIAGLVARRIVCNTEEGEFLKKGQRYGLIRFGSRVDLYMPCSVELLVRKGQRVLGGETIIGVRTRH